MVKSLVDTKDTAGICILHIGRNVLLLKDKKGDWGIPKGHVKEGEGMLQAALRETEEETRIKLTQKSHSFHTGVKRVHLGKNKENGVYQLFRCDIEHQMVPVLSKEHTHWQYFCLVNDCLPPLDKITTKYLNKVKKECE